MPPEISHDFTSATGREAHAKTGKDGPPAARVDPAARQDSSAIMAHAVFTLGLPPCRGKSSKNSCPIKRQITTSNEAKDSPRVGTVTPGELSKRLDSNCPTTIVVDCRSFLAYNKKHIEGAVNVNCTNCFTKRRLQQGKLSINDLATSDEGREALCSRSDKDVVVYDEDTQVIDDLPSNHSTLLVLNSLRNEGTRASLLKGGLKDFQNQFGSLCKSVVEKAPTTAETTICRPAAEVISGVDYTTAKQKEIDIPATQLLTFLYVGNEKDAADLDFLQQERIGNVLNVTQSVPCFHQETTNINYRRISVRDNSLANLKRHFEEAFVFIEAARKRHEKVLIHCSAGISRSSTIAIAYIMRYRGMPMAKAYNLVKSRRAIINPNLNFVGQLAAYEKTISSSIPAQCARQIKRRTASPHPAPPPLETAL
ncbi:dual specificity protein phosphatase 10-like [Acanthaster planci]|uniref:protein-tyrosine-phosphatase n=1 Tax=Acanthaster planci TaxID=133434 RepID=A0A8B7ZYN0_ACAPL|nr:dual specificity protein phosphatase 10-like [Acanthaster planci]